MTGLACFGWFLAGTGTAIVLMGLAWNRYYRTILRRMHDGAARRFVLRGEWERAMHVRASCALLEEDWSRLEAAYEEAA